VLGAGAVDYVEPLFSLAGTSDVDTSEVLRTNYFVWADSYVTPIL
jgi:hypothetical protein